MKTLISILNGGENSPKVSIRLLGLGTVYLIGLFVILLQLRSIL